MRRRSIAAVLQLCLAAASLARPSINGSARLLEAELARFPAKTGVDVKHLERSGADVFFWAA
ncbi:MAG: hypothetical protein ACRD2N_06970 [Vicinamibacterales bacterium]